MIDSFSGEFRFLSNFYPSQVKLDGLVYPTVEHAYQASKTLDPKHRLAIQKADTPGKAKRLGQMIKRRPGFDDKFRIPSMRLLLRKKFANPELRKLILETGNQELVEGNHWGDVFWGVCNGHGENHLGQLLMEERTRLRMELGDEALVDLG